MKTLAAMTLALLTLTGCQSSSSIDIIMDRLVEEICNEPLSAAALAPGERCFEVTRQAYEGRRTRAIELGCEEEHDAQMVCWSGGDSSVACCEENIAYTECTGEWLHMSCR